MLDTPPNVFVLLEGATCNDAARAVFKALLGKTAEMPAMRFYTANSPQEVTDYIATCREACSVNPVVITGTNERNSFKPFAHSVLSHAHFKRKGLQNSADWMIEVSAGAPGKCINQCVHCLKLWFGEGNFPSLISARSPELIVVPWGTLLAKDRLIQQ
jgi:hypothetical protein